MVLYGMVWYIIVSSVVQNSVGLVRFSVAQSSSPPASSSPTHTLRHYAPIIMRLPFGDCQNISDNNFKGIPNTSTERIVHMSSWSDIQSVICSFVCVMNLCKFCKTTLIPAKGSSSPLSESISSRTRPPIL